MTTTTTPEALLTKPKPTPKTLLKTRVPRVQRIPAPKLEVAPYEGRGLDLKQTDPQKHSAIVAALTAGGSLREVAAQFGMSKNSVGSIAIKELGADFVKRTTVSNLVQLVNLCSEDLMSEIDGVAPTQKAIILGICSDKLLAIEQRQTHSYALPAMHIQANISDAAVEKLILAATAKHTAPQPIIDINHA